MISLKRQFRATFVAVEILLSLCFCQAQELNQVEAKDILQKSRQALTEWKSSKISFEEDTKDIKTKTTSYSRRDQDGFTVRRTEFESFNAKTKKQIPQLNRVVITNRDGKWDVLGKTAIKKQFLDDVAKKVLQDIKQQNEMPPVEKTYKLKEVFINDTPCYQVTESISSNSLSELKKSGEEAIAVAKPSIIAGFTKAVLKTFNLDNIANVPYLTEYTIRKSDYALLAQKEYSESGDLLKEVHYDSVIFGLPLADNLFELPSGSKKKIATNLFEYLNLRKEASN